MKFNLITNLQSVLPKVGQPYHLLNLQSVPKECHSVVHHHHNDPVHSFKILHFLVLFIGDKPVLALEVYVYLDIPEDQSKILRTIYISKADTSGLCKEKVPVGRVIQTFLKWLFVYPLAKYFKSIDPPIKVDENANIDTDHRPFITETDKRLHILIERSKGRKGYGMPKITREKIFVPSPKLLRDSNLQKTRLIMFTRSEAQYLFPNSSKNHNKHILSDSGLLKWWLKNVEYVSSCDAFERVDNKRVTILNADRYEIRRYFPRGSTNWEVGDIYTDGNNDVALYHIPLLPDDPKGRFLEHLVVENRIKKVRMKQFWTELSIRQEFRLGITVGLVGLEGQTGINEIQNDVVIRKRNVFDRIRSLLVDIDYSDPVDYLRIGKGLREEKIKLNEFIGSGKISKPHIHALTAHTLQAHTLQPHRLTVRSKKINTLTARHK